MKLSILICTIPSIYRPVIQSYKLFDHIDQQARRKPVELLYLGDNKTMSVGNKRNLLLNIARGEYISFVDDDDWVSDDYVDTMLSYSEAGKDVHTIGVKYTQNQRPDMFYDYTYSKNINTRKDHKLIAGRVPDHLCLWKKEIAQRVKFMSTNLGEDHHWAIGQQDLGYSVAHNNEKIIYHYKFNSLTTQTRVR